MMHQAHCPKLLAVFGPLSLAGALLSPTAQAAEGGGEWVIEEVVVTAQKRAQSAQDVPIALNAFNEDMLEQMGVTDFGDLTKATPGFSLSGGSDAFPSPYMRGIGTNDNGVGTDPSVGIYIDGIYASRKGGAIGDLMDIASVEVLKGPQGTLFGRNSIGGAISITTQKPDNEFSGKVDLKAGNYRLNALKGMINIPLIEGQLFMRLSAAKRQRDGWQTNIIDGKKGNEKDRESARLRFTWAATDNWEIDVVNFWSRWDDTAQYAESLERDPDLEYHPLTGVIDDKYAVAGGRDLNGTRPDEPVIEPQLQRKLRTHSITVNGDIAESLSFSSLTAYRTYETFSSSQYEGTEYFVIQNDGSLEFNESISQEFRLNGYTNVLNWFVGASFQRERTFLDFDISLADALDINGGAPFTEKSFVFNGTKAYAIYGDATWSVTDSLNITFGARYSLDEKAIDYDNPQQDEGLTIAMGQGVLFPIKSQFVNEDGVSTPSLAENASSWTNLSPRLVADYVLLEDMMLYASVTAGYKSGGFNTYPSPNRDFTTAVGIDLTNFDPNNPNSGSRFLKVFPEDHEEVQPEEVISYELGVKSTWLDRRLTLNASVFAFDYTELQVLVIGEFNVQLRNAGKAGAHGFEFDTSYHLNHNWTIALNGLFIDATFDEFVDQGRDLSGTDMYFSPSFSGNLSVDYHVPVRDWGEFRTFVSYGYQGEHSIDPDYVQEAYGLLSANISFSSADENWSVSLWGNNIEDKAYIRQYTDQGRAVQGHVGATRNEPRTYGMAVSYRF